MEHLDDRLFAQFIAIIQSDEFSAMRRIAGDRPLPFSEFKTLPAPAGITQEQAWTLLCAMRKTVAITIPLTDAEGRRGWYSPTQSIARNLAEIDRACKENSALDLAISSKNTTYFLLESNIDDAIEAIRGDGLSMGHERARELILEERLPETPEEQLFANVRRVQHALPEIAEEPCTPAVIFDIYERVAEGVGAQEHDSIPEQPLIWQKGRLAQEDALQLVAEIVEGTQVDRNEHPLLLAQCVRHIFMSYLPLPAWNGAVAALCMKLLYLRAGLPVLVHVPIMKAQRDWMSGLYRPPAVAVGPQDSETLIDGEVDFTAYVDVYTKLVTLKLAEMKAEFDRIVRRDIKLSHELQGTIDVNHRQRMLLQQALDNPEAVFRIESHRAMNNIAYATARADLLGLVERGFLRKKKADHAFVFTVPSDLRQSLSSFLGAS